MTAEQSYLDQFEEIWKSKTSDMTPAKIGAIATLTRIRNRRAFAKSADALMNEKVLQLPAMKAAAKKHTI